MLHHRLRDPSPLAHGAGRTLSAARRTAFRSLSVDRDRQHRRSRALRWQHRRPRLVGTRPRGGRHRHRRRWRRPCALRCADLRRRLLPGRVPQRGVVQQHPRQPRQPRSPDAQGFELRRHARAGSGARERSVVPRHRAARRALRRSFLHRLVRPQRLPPHAPGDLGPHQRSALPPVLWRAEIGRGGSARQGRGRARRAAESLRRVLGARCALGDSRTRFVRERRRGAARDDELRSRNRHATARAVGAARRRPRGRRRADDGDEL